MFSAPGNIGYGKTASQTGTHRELSADLALDGVGFGIGFNGIDHCAHPLALGGAIAYWTVDLGKRHQILNVTIHNRRGKCCLKVVILD